MVATIANQKKRPNSKPKLYKPILPRKKVILQWASKYTYHTPLQRGKNAMVMVGKWKEKDGVQAYTITGTKEDLYNIVNEVRENGGKFDDTPIINHVHNGQYHVILKLKIAVGVGANDQQNNSS
jgi:hypothetical protein